MNTSLFAQVKGNTTVDSTVTQKEILEMVNIDKSNNSILKLVEGLASAIDLSGIKDNNDVSRMNSQIQQTIDRINSQAKQAASDIQDQVQVDTQNGIILQ